MQLAPARDMKGMKAKNCELLLFTCDGLGLFCASWRAHWPGVETLGFCCAGKMHHDQRTPRAANGSKCKPQACLDGKHHMEHNQYAEAVCC